MWSWRCTCFSRPIIAHLAPTPFVFWNAVEMMNAWAELLYVEYFMLLMENLCWTLCVSMQWKWWMGTWSALLLLFVNECAPSWSFDEKYWKPHDRRLLQFLCSAFSAHIQCIWQSFPLKVTTQLFERRKLCGWVIWTWTDTRLIEITTTARYFYVLEIFSISKTHKCMEDTGPMFFGTEGILKRVCFLSLQLLLVCWQ